MSINNKLNTIYGNKSLDLKVDDIDENKRLVKFYLSSFDTLDSDNDIIRRVRKYIYDCFEKRRLSTHSA